MYIASYQISIIVLNSVCDCTDCKLILYCYEQNSDAFKC